MKNIAVVGADTVVGHVVAKELAGTRHIRSFTLRPSSLPGAGAKGSIGLHDPLATLDGADCIIFCGDASRSSWDSGFGSLATDEKFLPLYAGAAAEVGVPLIFVSSDAVFRGPWVFHEEASDAFDDSDFAQRLRNLEHTVLRTKSNLVVRTNAIGSTGHGDAFLDTIVDAVLNQHGRALDCSTWSTPVAASLFAAMLCECLKHRVSGTLHLSGAERTSPWSFAGHLAVEMGSHRGLFTPARDERHRTERSLRCSRAREHFGLRMPTLNQSLDAVVESLQVGVTDLVAA